MISVEHGFGGPNMSIATACATANNSVGEAWRIIKFGDADAFIAGVRNKSGLDPQGLMCIPPIDEEPALHFALLAKIAARNGLKGLSMGMSHDFETAVAFGATHVRVGTAIFGPRAEISRH